MARELELEVNWDPVRDADVPVYPLAGRGHPVVSMEVDGVVAQNPFKGVKAKREYIVEVEFEPDGLTIDDEGFVDDYLRSFEAARVTQESMTRKIRNDLAFALDLEHEEIFVQVHRQAPANKRSRVGAIV